MAGSSNKTEVKDKKQKVLIIDQNSGIGERLQNALADDDMKLELSLTVEEGLQQARMKHHALILIDAGMHGSNFELIMLNLQMAKGTTPLIVLSRDASPRRKIECFERGADDYLVYPISAEELLARIRALLRRVELNRQRFLRRSRSRL